MVTGEFGGWQADGEQTAEAVIGSSRSPDSCQLLGDTELAILVCHG